MNDELYYDNATNYSDDFMMLEGVHDREVQEL